MRNRAVRIGMAGLLFLVGFLLLMYPFFSNAWNTYRSNLLIGNYEEQVAAVPKEDYSEWFARAERYNQGLTEKKIPDAFAFATQEEDEDYLSQLSFQKDGVMAYIEIPKISVRLPIYHTASREVLEKGVGHLQGSALPVGGENTHCILSAHRGLPSAALFTDLDLLEAGDHFYLYVLDQVLAYEVDQIQEVEPDQTESLAVVPGKDLVTLVTCTPYGVNSHRLLVRGRRVPYADKVAERESSHPVSSVHTHYGLWAFGGLLVTLFFAILLIFSTRRRT